jgi:regulator of replication initiation timing
MMIEVNYVHFHNLNRNVLDLGKQVRELAEENARLKAEAEGLYRHGDLMLKFAAANMTFPAYATMAKDWNAAKEGKQTK